MGKQKSKTSGNFFNFRGVRIEKRLKKAFNIVSIIFKILYITAFRPPTFFRLRFDIRAVKHAIFQRNISRKRIYVQTHNYTV